MIEAIKLKNFKCFQNQNIKLSNLNILCGLNGSGKSTLIQALLLIKQNSPIVTSLNKIKLEGKYYDFGTARDVLNDSADLDVIEFEIKTDTRLFKLSMEYDSLKNSLSYSEDPKEKKILTLKRMIPQFILKYISADRSGPRIMHKRYDSEFNNMIDPLGNYAVPFLADNINRKVAEHLLHSAGNTNSLLDQVNAWLSEISPNMNVNVNTFRDLGISVARFSDTRSVLSSDGYRPSNVGFGLSYILPILVTLLTAREGELIIIENPEAHLHPKAQASIGKLICLASLCKCQIIIETHSDHIINSVRLAIKDLVVKKENLNLYYFDRQSEESKDQPLITKIDLDDDGRISNWPLGFFDQWENDLIKLL